MFDIVAWAPTTPDRWALYTGIGWALGEPNIEKATFENEPVKLWRRPVDFLAHDFTGAVVLDWEAARHQLSGLTLAAENLEHGISLRSRLVAPAPKSPRIVLRKDAA